MATINDVCSLAAMTLIPNLYILSVPKHYYKYVANNMNFNSSLTTWMPPSCKLTTCHVTETTGIRKAGIKGFSDPQK